MKILFLANARRKGGLSGSDAIYESFIQHWWQSIRVQSMVNIDYKPFIICYIHRILLACLIALIEPQKFDFVYSTSDFWMDSLPGFIHKLRGKKWVAGYFLKSTKENKFYYYTQLLSEKIIRRFADMVIVTNPTMYDIFPDNKKTWINGVIDMNLAGSSSNKYYDAVFCGRIHPTKGIDELIEVWKRVLQKRPEAKLAVIGDGDLGKDYLYKKFSQGDSDINYISSVSIFGYLGAERYEIYKLSKVFLYPTPVKYAHFSIAPVEAMACGCPIIVFDTPVIRHFEKNLGLQGGGAVSNIEAFANMVISFIDGEWEEHSKEAMEWAKQFDSPLQAHRVFEEIRKGLSYENPSDWK